MNLSCNESRFNSKTSAILGTIEDVCKPELWCEPTGLLASIFPISSRPPAERLSSQLLDLLLRFLYNVKDAPGKMAQEGGFCGPTVEQTDVLIEACKKLKREALLWMPECGFMVMRVETPVGARAHDTCDLAILWLDGWATRSGG